MELRGKQVVGCVGRVWRRNKRGQESEGARQRFGRGSMPRRGGRAGHTSQASRGRKEGGNVQKSAWCVA